MLSSVRSGDNIDNNSSEKTFSILGPRRAWPPDDGSDHWPPRGWVHNRDSSKGSEGTCCCRRGEPFLQTLPMHFNTTFAFQGANADLDDDLEARLNNLRRE